MKRSSQTLVLSTLLTLGCSRGCGDPAPASDAPVAAPAADWIQPERVRKHAVLIVVDTFRADAMSLARTPGMDRLAASAEVGRAWSGSTWTAPSMISMFSGEPVRMHGWDFPFPRFMRQEAESYPPIPADKPLLAEVLKDAGFVTQAVYANSLLGGGLGFERGFDSFEGMSDKRIAAHVDGLVAGWKPDERHFLYVHLLGPHHPLRPSKRAAQRYKLRKRYRSGRGAYPINKARDGDPKAQRNYRLAYRAVVEDTDRRVRKILKALQPYREDTAIILTSDHGELLGEHGEWGHEHWVWEQLTAVPFIADGVGPLPDTLGTTAVPALLSAAVGVSHDWPSEGLRPLPLVSQRQGKLALSDDGVLKGIWDEEATSEPGPWVVDLSTDLNEDTPIRTEAPTARLVEARDAWERATPSTHLDPLSAAMPTPMLEMLEQLGYMGDSEEPDDEVYDPSIDDAEEADGDGEQGTPGDDGSDADDGSEATDGSDAADGDPDGADAPPPTGDFPGVPPAPAGGGKSGVTDAPQAP